MFDILPAELLLDIAAPLQWDTMCAYGNIVPSGLFSPVSSQVGSPAPS